MHEGEQEDAHEFLMRALDTFTDSEQFKYYMSSESICNNCNDKIQM
jgi:hypothetical protein